MLNSPYSLVNHPGIWNQKLELKTKNITIKSSVDFGWLTKNMNTIMPLISNLDDKFGQTT